MTEETTGGPIVTPTSGINGIPYDAIAGSATCQILGAGAGTAAQIAVLSALTGQIWGLVGGFAGVLAANALAAANGCFPVGEGPGPGGPGGIAGGQCLETEGCDLQLYYGGEDREGSQYVRVKKLLSSVSSGTYPNGEPKCTTTWVDCDGITQTDDEAIADLWPITTEVMDGGVCVGDPSPDNPGPGLPDPVPVPDPDGGPCTYVTQLVDAYINEAGGMSILYETCATGPGCSGCSRFWYHGPGDVQPAPPQPLPDPDGKPLPPKNPKGGDCPDPCEPCKFEPCEPPPAAITAGSFTFTSACGEGDDDEIKTATYNLPGGGDLQQSLQALADQNKSIMEMLQQHLLWKTPICKEERPELKGNWVTIRFESDAKSPNGKCRLRKLFRYRSQSTRDLGQLTTYWREFTWTTGPYCVYHKGSSLGTPQVWAASPDEGQRVIRNAFGEAGIDPDKTGEWGVSGSDNPRYGVSLPVRVIDIEGGHWVTSRKGPDGLPELALDP